MSPPSQARITEFMWALGDRAGGPGGVDSRGGKENAITVGGGEQNSCSRHWTGSGALCRISLQREHDSEEAQSHSCS